MTFAHFPRDATRIRAILRLDFTYPSDFSHSITIPLHFFGVFSKVFGFRILVTTGATRTNPVPTGYQWFAAPRSFLQEAKRLTNQTLRPGPLPLRDSRYPAKWKDFVSKNNMTWLQYHNGKWTGPIATQFDVKAIPATFSIDADGVLEDQHVGDADIEGRLKKMIAHAVAEQDSKPAPAPAQPGSGGN